MGNTLDLKVVLAKNNCVWIRSLSACVLFLILALVYTLGDFAISVLCMFVTLACLYEILRIKRNNKKDVMIQIFFVLYVLLSMACFFKLYLAKGNFILLFAISIVTFNDTAAFFVGRFIRGKKLAPKISPNKTWSGFLGGLTIGSILSFCLLNTFKKNGYLNISFETCLMASFASHFGDLLESLFKRYFDIKDTSSFIPGHGGIFDRLDSLLMVNIILYFLLIK
ncbi:MAG: hypothetical protein HEEMFOPI_01182 [Holosporales bacterium]